MTKSLSPTNLERAVWAEEALRVFQARTGCDYADVLGDLLCDLMHWADKSNFDWDAALYRAAGHHSAELDEAWGVDEVQHGLGDDPKLDRASPDALTLLKQAATALNTAPRFDVPALDTDSYSIASLCERAIARAKEGAA